MYNLILKDILLQKKMFLLSIVYVIFFLIVMQGAGFVVYPTALTAITYMLVVTSCAYDDKNKADVMLNSLPIKRAVIVLAKYLSIFVHIAISTVAYLVITTLISWSGLPVQTYPVSLTGLAGGLFAISLINSIYFPFYFKLGYIKSRFVNLILFFTLFFGLMNSLKLYSQNRDTAWAQNLQGFLQSQSDIQILTLFLVLIFMMQAVSFALSLKVYHSREF